MRTPKIVPILALCAATHAWAQSFPERPIQMVVPFGPSGTTDIMARLLADEFGRPLGGSVVVLNTAGAGGSIGMGNVARAKADGYTLSMATIGPLTTQPARRDGEGFRRFAAAEFQKFRKLVAENGLQECQ